MSIALANELATARAGARQGLRGVTFEEAMGRGRRWFPTLGKHLVAFGDPNGFATRQEAIDAARRFKALCRDFIDRERIKALCRDFIYRERIALNPRRTTQKDQSDE